LKSRGSSVMVKADLLLLLLLLLLMLQMMW
jgi:hypothetical protein